VQRKENKTLKAARVERLSNLIAVRRSDRVQRLDRRGVDLVLLDHLRVLARTDSNFRQTIPVFIIAA
jgi:hypothetical protein